MLIIVVSLQNPFEPLVATSDHETRIRIAFIHQSVTHFSTMLLFLTHHLFRNCIICASASLFTFVITRVDTFSLLQTHSSCFTQDFEFVNAL